jgi:RNA polymerase sigma-70 factor, ECF subfamily
MSVFLSHRTWVTMRHVELKSTRETIDTELHLMQRFADGDDGVVDEILNRIQPRVEKTASFLAKDIFEREDIIQSTLIHVLNAAGQFRGESSLSYWVDRITVYTALKGLEKRKRRTHLLQRFWMPEPEVSPLDDQVDLDRMKNALQAQLGSMRSEHRVILVLHYLHGYKINEIAELTDSKINTVRGRLRNALKKIRIQVKNDPVLKHWVEQAGDV